MALQFSLRHVCRRLCVTSYDIQGRVIDVHMAWLSLLEGRSDFLDFHIDWESGSLPDRNMAAVLSVYICKY